MKTSIKTFVCALALIATTTFAATAGDKENKKPSTFGTGIYPTKDGKINVLVDKYNLESKATLLLKNENGDVVYRETVGGDTKKFGRILNMDQMDAGKYRLDVIVGDEIQTKSFQVSEQKTERVLSVR